MRFRLVSEQKKDLGTGFSVLAARKMERELKNERGASGGGGRGRGGRKRPFFPTPSSLFHSRHFSRGL